MDDAWLTMRERSYYEGTVAGLRQQGWSRQEAEDEALDRLEALRAKARNTEDHSNAR